MTNDTGHASHEAELKEQFAAMRRRYGLDFKEHPEKIYRWDTLRKTSEFMRKLRSNWEALRFHKNRSQRS